MTDIENTADTKTPGVTSATPAGASVLTAPNADWKNRRPSNSNSRLEDVTEEGEDGLERRGSKGPPPVVRKWGPVPSLGAGPPRSQSFSVGQHQDSFVESQMKAAVKSVAPEDLDPAVLASMDEELTEEEYAQMIMEKLRSSRSKSTTLGTSPLGSSPRRGSTEGVWRAARLPLSGRSTGPPPGLGAPRPGGLGLPDDLRNQRRFSLAPSAFGASPSNAMAAAAAGGGTTMRLFGGALAHRGSTAGLPPEAYLALRRHSLAGPAPAPHTASSSAAYRHLSDALDHLQLDEFRKAQYGGLAEEAVDEYFDPEARRKSLADVGKGIPLSQIPTTTPLYIVEFKAGRSDLFYAGDSLAAMVKKGDLVIVEADRGKDLGKVVNDNITPSQVQQLQQQQAEQMPELLRSNKELHPKRIYRLAQPGEVAMLLTKSQDEIKALQICQTKVRQKKLPMEVVDAEYQWDRRKLTFYFVADRRIDFRELVRDLFKIYKTRIWMCAVNPAAATGAVPGVTGDTREE